VRFITTRGLVMWGIELLVGVAAKSITVPLPSAPKHKIGGADHEGIAGSEVALVPGATRGAGRGIAVQLGAAGATVYVTDRTSRSKRSEMNRPPETIEETATLVDEAGGRGIAVQVDHLVHEEVRALVTRIRPSLQIHRTLLV
jgi:hypothetical protein